MTITFAGILMMLEILILRLGIPILIIVVLCKALAHLCPWESDNQYTAKSSQSNGESQ